MLPKDEDAKPMAMSVPRFMLKDEESSRIRGVGMHSILTCKMAEMPTHGDHGLLVSYILYKTKAHRYIRDSPCAEEAPRGKILPAVQRAVLLALKRLEIGTSSWVRSMYTAITRAT